MKKKALISIIAVVVCLAGVLLAGCSMNDKAADLVVYGTIYTAESDNDGLAEAFAVKDGKYVYVGSKEGVKQYVKEGKTEVIDRTNQGLIIPGSTEGHCHYFGQSAINNMLPCANCTYVEMLETLKAEVAKGDCKQFLSFGFNSMEILGRVQSKDSFTEELEQIAPGIPIVLMDGSAHNAVCSTTALKKAGLYDNPTLRGGTIHLDSKGKPSGYISDQAVYYVLEKALDKPLTDEQYKQGCVDVMNELLSYGYTNTFDAFTNVLNETGTYETLKKMDEAGDLKMYVAEAYHIMSCDAQNFEERVDRVVEINNKYKSKHLSPSYIKIFVDGVVESGTGWMTEAYKNASEGKEHGNIIWNPDELSALTKYANSKNILIHTHSYGDAACKTAIDAFVASNKANGKEYRNCLSHVRNIQGDDVIRAAENKIPIAENLIWHSDYDESKSDQLAQKEHVLSKISEDIYYSGYPMKSLMVSGVNVSSSTDAPAALAVPGTVMNAIEVATTGITPNDNAKPFAPSELLSVREALQALTINGAWQLGIEKERGSVKVGKYADFVILDKNILNYQGEQLRTIHETKILNTYFEGKNVYTAK